VRAWGAAWDPRWESRSPQGRGGLDADDADDADERKAAT
jgi:hypothetical protein